MQILKGENKGKRYLFLEYYPQHCIGTYLSALDYRAPTSHTRHIRSRYSLFSCPIHTIIFLSALDHRAPASHVNQMRLKFESFNDYDYTASKLTVPTYRCSWVVIASGWESGACKLEPRFLGALDHWAPASHVNQMHLNPLMTMTNLLQNWRWRHIAAVE